MLTRLGLWLAEAYRESVWGWVPGLRVSFYLLLLSQNPWAGASGQCDRFLALQVCLPHLLKWSLNKAEQPCLPPRGRECQPFRRLEFPFVFYDPGFEELPFSFLSLVFEYLQCWGAHPFHFHRVWPRLNRAFRLFFPVSISNLPPCASVHWPHFCPWTFPGSPSPCRLHMDEVGGSLWGWTGAETSRWEKSRCPHPRLLSDLWFPEWLNPSRPETLQGPWEEQLMEGSSLRPLLAMLGWGGQHYVSPKPWFDVGSRVTGQAAPIRCVMKVFPTMSRTYVSRTDMCLLIPLQELIDLKMLQCKRVVNGECSCGPRIVCMPGHAQTVLPLPLPGCQCPPGCSLPV